MPAKKQTLRPSQESKSRSGSPSKTLKLARKLTNNGNYEHLVGVYMPSLPLIATSGRSVDLSKLTGRVVVYCYPKTGKPGMEMPAGWETIPGATGCTAESCAFRDQHNDLQVFNCQLFGLSTQSTEYQREAARRLHLPFELLSDVGLEYAHRLQLPMFQLGGETFIKRLTLISKNGRIEKVFYPIEHSEKNADDVIRWLAMNLK